MGQPSKLGKPLDASMVEPHNQSLFWDRVKIAFAPGKCWAYTGSIEPNGYLRHVMIDKHGSKMRVLVHRLSYALSRGPIPAGMYVCHTCDNRYCVRPDHLFLGSPQDNTDDMVRKGRKPVGNAIAASKLTPELARLVFKSTDSLAVTASKLGISKKLVLNIKARRAWAAATI